MILFQKKHDWILGGFEYLRADDVEANAGSGGAIFRTDQLGTGQHVPFTKLMSGTADDTAVIPGDATNGLYVQVKAAAATPVTDNGGTLSIDDGAGSITVDGTVGVSGTVAVTDNGGNLSVDDGGGSLTVDGTVAATQSGTWVSTGAAATDAAVSGSPVYVASRASAAAPTDVSADGDVVPDWNLRSGAKAVQPTFAGVLQSTGNGTAGTGTPRVTIASDNTAFTVNAAQSGTWTVQPGNTANTTPWKVDASSAAVPVTDNSGSLTVDNGGTFAVQAAQSGNWSARIVGNAGATLDGTIGAGTAPTNMVAVGSVYNTTAPAPTNGQAMAQQADQAGNLRTAPGIALATLSAWSSATSVNATQNIFTNSGANAALVYAVQSAGSFSAGAITFEITYDNSTWATISADAVIDPTSTTLATQAIPYTLVSATNKAFLILCKGAQGLRIKLSTAITGTGTTTPNYALLSYSPVQQTILGASSATIGALTANQSVNVAQMNGVTVTMGNGVAGTGVQRVTLASDSTGQVTLAAGSATIGALTANQSVNISQHNGVTPLMGAGATGTGSPRVTLATDGQGQLVDNAAFTDGTTRLDMAGFIFDETAGTALTENDAAAARIDSKRALIMTIEDGTTRGQRQAVNSGGAAEVHGDAAHDAAVAGNPVRVAGQARSSDYTAVANADTADFITDLTGKQIVLPYSIPENSIYGATAAITGTGATQVFAAGAAGIRNFINSLTVTNSHATVGTVVEIRDGTTTVLHRGYAAPAGGGYTITFPTPLRGTAATAVNAYNITTGSNTYVSASGYTGP